MPSHMTDKFEIAELMTGWMYRDLAQWDKLRTLFHPDGTIEVTWFEGKFSDFVDASQRMGASKIRTKHVITSPIVTIHGNRAIAETNAIILAQNAVLGLSASQHSRFYDLLEKRDDVWKIVTRNCIYDMGNFDFPVGKVEIDTATLERYPREYAPIAYIIEKSGFPIGRVFPTIGSELEKTLKASAQVWLAG